MAPKTPTKKSTTASKQNDKQQKLSLPPLSPGNEAGPPSFQDPAVSYRERQDEEILSLQSILGKENVEIIDVKGAWNKTLDKAFNLCVKPLAYPDTYVVIFVKFTATYPKTVPNLSIKECSADVQERTMSKIAALLDFRPKELVGEEMIYTIVTEIDEILESGILAKQKNDALPNLETERAVQEAADTERQAKELREQEQQRADAKAEEDERLNQMVEIEIKKKEKEEERKRKLRQSEKLDISIDVPPERIVFDIPISVQDALTDVTFKAVYLLSTIGKGPVTTAMRAVPVGRTTPLVVKRLHLKHSIKGSKTEIFGLERELHQLKKLRHPNIMAVLDFKIDTEINDNGWELFILTQLGNKGSLADLLDTVETVPLHHVRSWTIELLEGLQYYHRHGITHRDIHPNNVLIVKANGMTFVKLADAAFQKTLHVLAGISSKAPVAQSGVANGWMPPEFKDTKVTHSSKTDIWDAGVVFLQMIFGLSVRKEYDSPLSLVDKFELSEPFEGILRKFFKAEPRARQNAFDIVPSAFLHGDIPVSVSAEEQTLLRRSSAPIPLRRRDSVAVGGPGSRWAIDWAEQARLGKGAYGEVVRARHQIDGQVYAVKKIMLKSAPNIDKVLKEASLLAQLNHPNVVRYFTAWKEVEYEEAALALEDTETEIETEDESDALTSSAADAILRSIDLSQDLGGLDIISSQGFPQIEFGESSDESSSETADNEDGIPSVPFQTPTRETRPALIVRKTPQLTPIRTILYIQMEFCEKRTLRDLIVKDIHEDSKQGWLMFRDILEGLNHIHQHGVIHRDLKPDNVFIDMTKKARIGDFGLATLGEYELESKGAHGQPGGDRTRSVGTALYVAPELKTAGTLNYSAKVDMYSLGVIFFELCYPLKTAMERVQTIKLLREKEHSLPSDFDFEDKAFQGEIIMALLNHRPSERPSSAELIANDKVPARLGNDILRLLRRTVDDQNAPMHAEVMGWFFHDSLEQRYIERAAYLANLKEGREITFTERLMRKNVTTRLTEIMRRHGAVESDRSGFFRVDPIYQGLPTVKMLFTNGKFHQMPYDLTLPFAMHVATYPRAFEKNFTIGRVFRRSFSGEEFRVEGEADFDIISQNAGDMLLYEAEVIRVADEIVQSFPPLVASQMCINLGHFTLLDLIMDFARIETSKRVAVREVLSLLHYNNYTWEKIRAELRSPRHDIPSTSLVDLSRFDFKDTPEKTFAKLRALLEGTEYLSQMEPIFAHILTVLVHLKTSGVRCPIFVSPLTAIGRVYTGGIVFECVRDKKRRDVFITGGRYDKLLEELQPSNGHHATMHAVGMRFSWDRIVTSMVKYQERKLDSRKASFLKKSVTDEGKIEGYWTTRRCDILVASFDAEVLKSSGVKILGELWDNNINAQLAIETQSLDELLTHYRTDPPSWIVIIKRDAAIRGKLEIRVRSLVRNQDSEVRSNDLISFLRTELRDRDQREGTTTTLSRLPSRNNDGMPNPARNNNVHVLFSQHKGKKSNKWLVIEAAQEASQKLLDSYRNAPIAAIETRDDFLDQIGRTRLSDPNSWREVINRAPQSDRQYLGQVRDMLEAFKQSEASAANGDAPSKVAFVYNFRTSTCVLYDLAL